MFCCLSFRRSRQLGTSSLDSASGVATDSSGNVYVAGYTEGGLDGNSSAGSWDLFVVKYDSDGNKQWTQQLGTSSHDFAYGFATDSSGNVYVAGMTYGGLDGNSNSGEIDLFIVKYNSSGTKQWTKQLGSSSEDSASGVATDSSGNFYVAGYTYGGLDGNSNSGCNDLFVVKYDSDGNKK
ncbi:MAG: SBBP repeat-containing protein [SAR324 cluster bacterium]|nr:SBBP repeat-containing protein [SAR324 cluster bacterium]